VLLSVNKTIQCPVNSVVNPDYISGHYYITAGITSGVADYGFWTRNVCESLMESLEVPRM
jgi:hypothetical protein